MEPKTKQLNQKISNKIAKKRKIMKINGALQYNTPINNDKCYTFYLKRKITFIL